jgi:hypothetical protein
MSIKGVHNRNNNTKLGEFSVQLTMRDQRKWRGTNGVKPAVELLPHIVWGLAGDNTSLSFHCVVCMIGLSNCLITFVLHRLCDPKWKVLGDSFAYVLRKFDLG